MIRIDDKTVFNPETGEFASLSDLTKDSIKKIQYKLLAEQWELINGIKKENLLKVLALFNKNNLLIDAPFLLLNRISTLEIIKETHLLESLIGFSELKKLEALYLRNSKVKSLDGIEDLIELKYVHIGQNSLLKNIDTIKTCKNVELFEIKNCPIEDPAPITALKFLKSLGIGNNKFTEFDFIKNLDLNSLSIINSKLKSMDFLSTQVNLKSLYLYTNDISDISALANLQNLEHLSLSNNTNLIDLSPLSGLQNLKYLDISNTKVNSLKSLSSIPLKSLKITDTKIFDLSPLNKLGELTLIWDRPFAYEILKYFKPRVKLKQIHRDHYVLNR